MAVASKLSVVLLRHGRRLSPQSSTALCNSQSILHNTHSVRYQHTDLQIDPASGLPLVDPKKGVLIYAGNFTKYISRIKLVGFTTSALAVAVQPYVVSVAQEDMLLKAGALGTISTLVFCTPALVHIVAKKYITDIYFNDETKTFTLARKSFFLRRIEEEFKADDVKLPFVGGAFVNHIIKGKKYFIDITSFRSKDIYKHMVGYDKPFEHADDELLLVDDAPKPKKEPAKKFGLFADEVEDSEANIDPTKNRVGQLQDEPNKMKAVRPEGFVRPSVVARPYMMEEEDDAAADDARRTAHTETKH